MVNGLSLKREVIGIAKAYLNQYPDTEMGGKGPKTAQLGNYRHLEVIHNVTPQSFERYYKMHKEESDRVTWGWTTDCFQELYGFGKRLWAFEGEAEPPDWVEFRHEPPEFTRLEDQPEHVDDTNP